MEELEECLICYSDEILYHQGCGHRYCSGCWGGYLSLKVTEERKLFFFCLHPDCSHFVRKDFILTHISDSAKVMYQQIIEKEEIKPINRLLSLFSCSFPPTDGVLSTCPDIDYYHYECLSEIDTGWGCSYRCIQSLLSAVHYAAKETQQNLPIPSIYEIQCQLASLEVETCFRANQVNTPAWIGPYEISMLLKMNTYQSTITCTVTDEVTGNSDCLRELINSRLPSFFNQPNPMPIICANGLKTYMILGSVKERGKATILVLDPHFSENLSYEHFEAFYDSDKVNPVYISDQSDVNGRMNEMLRDALRMEESSSFFSSQPLWCILWPSLK